MYEKLLKHHSLNTAMYGKHLEMVLKAAMSIASAFSYVSLLRYLTKSGVREKGSLFVQKFGGCTAGLQTMLK